MEYEQIFLLVWSLVMLFIFLGLYLRGKNELSRFPDFDSTPILFEERKVSGRVLTGDYFVRAGSNKLLHVYVTNCELWVKTHWINAAAVSQSGMLHKVSLELIESVEYNDNGKVIVKYKTRGGVGISFWLKLRNAKEFLRAMETRVT